MQTIIKEVKKRFPGAQLFISGTLYCIMRDGEQLSAMWHSPTKAWKEAYDLMEFR